MSSVSVVIPTYKASPFIRETLASVFAQSRLPDEVIVVDDCSPDDTLAVVEQIAPTAPVPIRVIRLEKNSGGPAIPLTVGFDSAKGDYVAALDQDDVLLPQKLARQTAMLDQFQYVCFAFGGCAHLSASNQLRHQEVFDSLGLSGESGIVPGSQMLDLLLSHGQFLIGFPGFTFRRTAWAAIRPLNSTLQIVADYDYLCRLCTCGHVAFVNEVHYLWRSHSGNMTKQSLTTTLETIWLLRRELQRLNRSGGLVMDQPADQSRLIQRIRQNLRRELLDASYTYRRSNQYKKAVATCGQAIRYGALYPGLVEGMKIAAAAALAVFQSRQAIR